MSGVRALVLAAVAVLGFAPSADAAWDHTNTLPAGSGAIDGYASQVSVAPGGTLDFHVSTRPAEPYRIDLYRLGAFATAPARLACVPACDGSSSGSPATPSSTPPGWVGHGSFVEDPVTDEIRADWPVTDHFTVPVGWRSGLYVARLTLLAGGSAGEAKLVPFVVREAPASRSPVLIVAPVNTWQAYNLWGGADLYRAPNKKGAHAVKVSFDRPYIDFRTHGPSAFDWEEPLYRFVEGQRSDLAYTTDVDVATGATSLAGRKLVIVAGHGEYWTLAERRALAAARDTGVNLIFAGANDGFWQVRYEQGTRTIVAYKGQRDFRGDPDPQSGRPTETTQFRRVGHPECDLLGVQYVGRSVSAPGYDERVPDPARSPWFAGSGFKAGNGIRHIVGYEYDYRARGCVPKLARGTSLVTLLHADARDTDGKHPQDAVTYEAPSGARVFSAGTLELSWALDSYGQADYSGRMPPDGRMQAFARNMLADLARGRAQPGGTVPSQPGTPTARRGTYLAGRTVRVRRRRLLVLLGCRSSRACSGRLTVTVRWHRRRVAGGSARFRIRAGGKRWVAVRLSRRALRLLSRRGASVVVTVREGRARRPAFSVVLRRLRFG